MVTVEFIAHVSWYFYVACQATLASATHSRCAFLRDAFVLSYAGVPFRYCSPRPVRYAIVLSCAVLGLTHVFVSLGHPYCSIIVANL